MSGSGFYPIYLRLKGKRCVVAGGGKVAERKVRALARHGASVTVVSPALSPRLLQWAARGRIQHVKRCFRAGDLRGAWLAYGATDDQAVNAAVFRAATRRRIWVNVVDQPRLCQFISAAVVERRGLSVAISTGGRSPGLAKRLRQQLERAIGPEHGELAEALARLRPRILRRYDTPHARKQAFERVIKQLLRV